MCFKLRTEDDNQFSNDVEYREMTHLIPGFKCLIMTKWC